MGCIAGGAQRIDGPPPPPDDRAGGPGRTYESDLYEVAKKGATMEGHLPHPDMSGATAGDIHAKSVLFPKNEAAARNAERELSTPEYHEERAIIGYFTSIPTDGLGRVHGPNNQEGHWVAKSVDFGGSSAEAMANLSLTALPTLQSDVQLFPGTYVEASRPVSDAVRQYYFYGHLAHFSNTRTFG